MTLVVKSFSPDSTLSVQTHRQLPHWSQSGTATFVTWRTADSIPYEKVYQWRDEKLEWLSDHGIKTEADSISEIATQLPTALKSKFHRRFANQWHDELDRGRGECVLGDRKMSQIVADALLHFDGERYELDRFVVMPNHLHLLVSFQSNEDMLKQCRSWKQFTSRALNKERGTTGRFWMQDSFDHLVRSQRQMEWLQSYIEENPVKAGLADDESLYWEADGT